MSFFVKIKNGFSEILSLLRNSKRAFGYAWQFVPYSTLFLLIFALIYSTLPYLQSKYLGSLVDTLISSIKTGNIDTHVWWILALYAIFNALPGLMSIVRNYIDKHWYIKLQDNLDILGSKERGEVDVAKMEDPAYQDLLQKAWNRGIWPIMELIDSQFENIRLVLEIIFGSVLAITFSWKIYLLVILFSIPSFISQIKYGKQVWGIWAENSTEQRLYHEFKKFFSTKTPAIEAKIYQTQENILLRIKEILFDFEVKQIKTERKGFWYKFFAGLLSDIGFFLALVLLILDVVHGSLAVGIMIFMIGTISRLNSSVSNLLSGLARQFEKNFYVRDMFAVFDTKPVIQTKDNPETLNLTSAPKIEFKNVSFAYPGQDKNILSNFNLIIEPGQKVGIVGDNGAGKTTFIRLLLRIHDPIKGQILINGKDLRDLDLNEWWSYAGVLLQNYANYHLKTKESISMGRASDGQIDEKLVVDSAKMSTANEFIEEWKEKYESMLGVEFGGMEMSKGQNQKLAIARVFYRNPFLYILDEPTAAIDARSSIKIFENLEGLSKQITAIIISHNYSTIRHADKIILINGGKIEEEGTHEELMAMKGNYATLFNKQKAGFK